MGAMGMHAKEVGAAGYGPTEAGNEEVAMNVHLQAYIRSDYLPKTYIYADVWVSWGVL